MGSEGLQMSNHILWKLYFLAIFSLVRCEVSVDCASKALGGTYTSGLFLVDCTLSRNLHAEETVVWMSENCMVIGKCNSTVCNATAEVQLFTLAYIFGLSTTQSTETGPFIFSMYTTHNDSFLNSVQCSLNYCESTSSCVHGLACQESTSPGNLNTDSTFPTDPLTVNSWGSSYDGLNASVSASVTSPYHVTDKETPTLSPLVLACILTVVGIALIAGIIICFCIYYFKFRHCKRDPDVSLSHTYHGTYDDDMILSNNDAIDVDMALPLRGADRTPTDLESSTSGGVIYQEIDRHYDLIQNHLKPLGEDTSTFIPKEQFRGHGNLKCQSAESDPELYNEVSSPNTSEVFYSTQVFKKWDQKEITKHQKDEKLLTAPAYSRLVD